MSASDIRALFEARRKLVATPIPYPIPGFGDVFVKVLDAETAAANAQTLSAAENKDKYLVLAAGLSICDEAGALVFDIKNADDLAILSGIDPKTLSAIFQKSQLENGQGVAGAEAAGNV